MRSSRCTTPIYWCFERGIGTRNVLIVGTGPVAQARRHHLDSTRHLGYTFKGFINLPGTSTGSITFSDDVVGKLDNLFDHARRQFVDEIFFTTPCERGIVQDLLEQARTYDVDLKIVPDLWLALARQYSTIPVQNRDVPVIGLMAKRFFDVIFSTLVLILISPLLLIIAVAIKLDSPGPIFYSSERIGKKGRIIWCTKFRTFVSNGENLRADLDHLNEGDGILSRIADDPRITRLGRFLRK